MTPSLTRREKIEAYIIPYYAFVTGTRWGFRKRVKKEFDKKALEYRSYGESTKAELFLELEGKAVKVFRWFTYLIVLVIVLVGLLIVIFVD